jgi:dienelactone hydrolase
MHCLQFNMRRWLKLTFLLGALVPACASVGTPQEAVRFPSLEGGTGREPTLLNGYLFKPEDGRAHPALVFLHGCGGLINSRAQIESREADWAARFTRLGYVVLLVDSFSPRGHGEMCSQRGFDRAVYLERPRDAYGALRYLQALPFVRPDRIGLVGWSQGGGVVLLSIRSNSLGRPPELPAGDFRVAVAFYPASCRDQAHRLPWTSSVPLLVLVGDRDNWTPAEPCKAFLDEAVERGSEIDMRIYPGAYHDFDWPNNPVHELPAYRTAAGVTPIAGTDIAARDDALVRVAQFLGRYLQD